MRCGSSLAGAGTVAAGMGVVASTEEVLGIQRVAGDGIPCGVRTSVAALGASA
jgi:hypothetical protein